MPIRPARLLAHAWAVPNTVIGLAAGCLLLLTGGSVRPVEGVLEFHGGLLADGARRCPRRLPFRAITFGHVILGTDPALLAAVRRHEHVHVRQYERWGPLFLPAYLLAGLWQWLHGRRAYRDNPFEREAFGSEDGPSG
jgi:hypothetical protein